MHGSRYFFICIFSYAGIMSSTSSNAGAIDRRYSSRPSLLENVMSLLICLVSSSTLIGEDVALGYSCSFALHFILVFLPISFLEVFSVTFSTNSLMSLCSCDFSRELRIFGNG